MSHTIQHPTKQRLFQTWSFPGGLTITRGSRQDNRCVVRVGHEYRAYADRLTVAQLIKTYRRELRQQSFTAYTEGRA